MSGYVWLVELVPYDPGTAGTVTLRYCTGKGFSSSSAYYKPYLRQPSTLRRDLFGAGNTLGVAKVGAGEMILANPGGALDALLEYAWDGRAATAYYGPRDGTFPDDFTAHAMTMEQAEFTRTEVRIRLRDKMLDLDKPLQATKYAGSNTLPSGTEGVTDLKGKPKPLAYGGPIRNVNPPCVNTSKLLYQIHDGALDSIVELRDRGVSLGGSSLAADVQELEVYANWETMYSVAYSAPQARWAVSTAGGVFFSDDDGVTWRHSRVPTPAGGAVPAVYQIIWGRGVWVAVGSSGLIAISAEGVVWEESTTPFSTAEVAGAVAYSAALDLYVCGGSNGELYTSTDAVTWTSRTSPLTTLVEHIAWSASQSLFVAVANGNEIATSPTGVTWTSRTSDLTSGNLYCVAFSDSTLDRWVIGGASSGSGLQYSDDGITWVEATGDGGAWILDVTWTPWGFFLAVGDGGEMFTSEDGATWTSASNDFGSSRIYGVGASDERVVISADDKKVARSSTGLGLEYASQADLEDDALAPPPGSWGYHLASGLVRLGSPPDGAVTCDVIQGDTAADRTAGRIFSALLTEAGKTAPALTNLCAAVSAWTGDGVLTTGIADPVGGTGACTIADDNAAAQEEKVGAITGLSGNAVKSCVFVVKERSCPASGQRLALRDTSAGADRLALDITDWVDGEPQVAETTGTHVRSLRLPRGFWAIFGESTSVTAANTHQAQIYPAITAGEQGSIDAWKVYVHNATDADAGDWYLVYMDLIDAMDDSTLALWTGLEEITVIEAINRVARGLGAWWGPDREGKYRIQKLVDPSAETSIMTFTANKMVLPLNRLSANEPYGGLPTWRVVNRYDRNYFPQQDLAGSLDAEERADHGLEWRTEPDEDSSVKTTWLLAQEITVDTLYTEEADAAAEASRVLALRDQRRDRYEFTVPLDENTAELDLGDVVTVEHARFGLSAGKKFVITTIEMNAAEGTMYLNVWG